MSSPRNPIETVQPIKPVFQHSDETAASEPKPPLMPPKAPLIPPKAPLAVPKAPLVPPKAPLAPPPHH
jgi:hypothetical protein